MKNNFILFLCLLCSTIIFAQAPTSLQYPVNNVFRANADNVYITPTVAGNVTGYTISPALPAGLAFNTNTGIISGVPTTGQASIPYTITATNASGSTNTSINIQIFNYYYNNNNGAVSFLAAKQIPKVFAALATAGQTAGDIVLYDSVCSIGSQAIGCIVKTVSVTNVTAWDSYDQPLTSGTYFNSNSDNFFSPQVTFGTATGGSINFNFQFILGGSYNNVTNTGTNISLQNVKLNTYDIDGNGTAIQSNEFDGFTSSELSTPVTNEVVSFNASNGFTVFTSNTSVNTIPVTDALNRIRVTYANISNIEVKVAANNTGLAYYFLDFSSGGAFTTQTTSAPTIDLNSSFNGVNNTNTGCAVNLPFSGGTGQANAASATDLTSLSVGFKTAEILNGVNEKLLINAATSGGTIALNFANAAAIPNVVLGTITYAVTANVTAGVSTLTFTRSSGALFTVARAEELIDALRYQNIAATPTNGNRNFIVNMYNTTFKSPDAIFTATLNCVGLSGNIFHDSNGLTDNIVNPSAAIQFANNSMFAVLVDPATNQVLKTQPITSGAYNFGNASPGKYLIYFSNSSSPAIGSVFTASTYPTGGYTSTGENLGAGNGSDLNINGVIEVTLGTVAIANANFGLQIPPTATGTNVASCLNPGGYNAKTITGTNFGTADADGSVTSINITSFPSNANYLRVGSTYYINGGSCPPQVSCTTWPGSVTIPYSAGAPSSAIAVDPIDGANTVTINYTSRDNAGANSNSASIQIPFSSAPTPLSISGKAWNDANANGIVDAGEAQINPADAGHTLYAVLVQTSNTYSASNTIYASMPISASTGYNFTNVPAGNNYTVQIISLPTVPVEGSASSSLSASLANNFTGVSTNNSGTVSALQNTNNLVNVITGLASSIVNVDFGLDRLPTANNANHTIAAPSLNSSKALTAISNLSPLSGFDPEDGVIGAGASIKFTSVAGLNGNILKYDGVTITAGMTIANYDPAKLVITFAAQNSIDASFTFVFVDNAGVPGTSAATYNITWGSVLAAGITNFNAVNKNEKGFITFKNTSEQSIKWYVVEHSANAATWLAIETLQPGNNTGYSITDNNPFENITYYRLQIIKVNGSVEYTDIKKVNFATKKWDVTLWPNPATHNLNVSSITDEKIKEILIIGLDGKIIKRNISNNTTLNIDVSKLATAAYFLQITGANNNKTTIQFLKN